MIGQRNMLCGMHVHVEFPDPARRVDVMTRMLPYRAAVHRAVDLVAVLARPRRPGSKAIGSPPMTNCRAPACPSCSAATTNTTPMSTPWCSVRRDAGRKPFMVGDPAVAEISDAWSCARRIAARGSTTPSRSRRSTARWRAICMLNPEHNAGIDVVDRAIAVENKWRAQRYGVQGTFRDPVAARCRLPRCSTGLWNSSRPTARRSAAPSSSNAAAPSWLEGTSADAQLRIFTENEHEGADIALHKVTSGFGMPPWWLDSRNHERRRHLAVCAAGSHIAEKRPRSSTM